MLFFFTFFAHSSIHCGSKLKGSNNQNFLVKTHLSRSKAMDSLKVVKRKPSMYYMVSYVCVRYKIRFKLR